MQDNLLHIQSWYAGAGVLLTLLIQIFRKQPWLSKMIWERVPEGARFLLPLIGGATVAFVAAYSEGKPVADALMAALGGVMTIGFGSMGVAAGLKESPIPWDGGSGGKPKKKSAVPTLAGSALCSFILLTGCGLFGSDPKPPDAEDACPGAAKAMTVDCPALAVAKCEGKPWDECAAREEIEAECDKLIDEEMAKCP